MKRGSCASQNKAVNQRNGHFLIVSWRLCSKAKIQLKCTLHPVCCGLSALHECILTSTAFRHQRNPNMDFHIYFHVCMSVTSTMLANIVCMFLAHNGSHLFSFHLVSYVVLVLWLQNSSKRGFCCQ